jgi:hypothetical protein
MGHTEPFVTDDGDEIPYLGNTAEQFLNRSTALYGSSNSGKSVAIKAIMKMLSTHIEQVILVSPTEPQNQDYKGIIPSIVTHHRIWLPEKDHAGGKKTATKSDRKGGMRFFEQLWERQEFAMQIYNKANRMDTLKSLYNRVATERTERGLRKLGSYRERGVHRIRKHYSGGEMERRIREFNEKLDDLRRAFYKKQIAASYNDLEENIRSLSTDERMSLEHLEFNPNILLVLDDCAAEMTNAIVSSPIFRKLFFQGRHLRITLLVSCHTPNDLASGLRKNTYNCIFTTADSAISYFSNTTNGFAAAQKKESCRLVTQVFEARDPKFLKFAYVRDSPQRFHVFKVNYPRTFRFGCSALWEMDRIVAEREGALDRSNPFYKAYGFAEDRPEEEVPAVEHNGGGGRADKKERGHKR